jgi:hypothetical protein
MSENLQPVPMQEEISEQRLGARRLKRRQRLIADPEIHVPQQPRMQILPAHRPPFSRRRKRASSRGERCQRNSCATRRPAMRAGGLGLRE